ncbi:hypothetical protein AcW1_005966 [Taiwanofungus camphoratus]|nr:hypothetical protein AcW2_004719 [Antrodia cinnamomea]KAI0934443.1 hypothetical protein AcV5_006283 [Antrodia cinnamomea]KAI0950269.1 hypothetical protein AcV7_008790 [Antrodia cinnamomea]KAI0957641.1 hypothetical protein AcW1_005966 [Antrodia cinnamomea]
MIGDIIDLFAVTATASQAHTCLTSHHSYFPLIVPCPSPVLDPRSVHETSMSSLPAHPVASLRSRYSSGRRPATVPESGTGCDVGCESSAQGSPSLVYTSPTTSFSVDPSILNFFAPATSTPPTITSSLTTSLAVAASSSPRTSAQTRAATSHTGAIVGGCVGGISGLLVVLGVMFLCCRHRRKTRIAPSAEFMAVAANSARPGSPQAHIPFARQASIEDEQPPPAFTPGEYKDPVIEKVRAARAQQQQYQSHNRERGHYESDSSSASWDKTEKTLLIE